MPPKQGGCPAFDAPRVAQFRARKKKPLRLGGPLFTQRRYMLSFNHYCMVNESLGLSGGKKAAMRGKLGGSSCTLLTAAVQLQLAPAGKAPVRSMYHGASCITTA